MDELRKAARALIDDGYLSNEVPFAPVMEVGIEEFEALSVALAKPTPCEELVRELAADNSRGVAAHRLAQFRERARQLVQAMEAATDVPNQ